MAEEWFAPEVEELGRLSFGLHRELAQSNDGKEKWGYLRSTGVSYSAGVKAKGEKGDRGEDWLRAGGSRGGVAGISEVFSDDNGPAWLKRGVGDSMEVIGDEGTLAQMYVQLSRTVSYIHEPYKFSRLIRLVIPFASANTSYKFVSHEASNFTTPLVQFPWKKTCVMNCPASKSSTHPPMPCRKSHAHVF